ncbi:hypothetical protein [Faecalicatena orotica]|jgi:hypothetical protein
MMKNPAKDLKDISGNLIILGLSVKREESLYSRREESSMIIKKKRRRQES